MTDKTQALDKFSASLSSFGNGKELPGVPIREETGAEKSESVAGLIEGLAADVEAMQKRLDRLTELLHKTSTHILDTAKVLG